MSSTGDPSRLDLLQKVYDRLFTSATTLSKLRDSAISDRLYPGTSDSIYVAGRSLAWKLFLAEEEPLHAALSPRPASLLTTLRDSRSKYQVLMEQKTQPPDKRLDRQPSAPSSPYLMNGESESLSHSLDFNNPLSLHDENPWNEWFAGVELRKVISQDVERTFPEIHFFRQPDVQAQLTNILFLYSTTHPAIGYRQGMHELLAPLYLAVTFDALQGNEIKDERYSALANLCAFKFVDADAWALFTTVMEGVGRWYEWRDPAEAQPSSPSRRQQLPMGQDGVQPFVAPIVHTCNRIQGEMLKACDPQLWRHLRDSGIEPQIYGIRWLRMLFTREFSMSDSLKLWDGLFACDASLDIAQWICIAMLIRIRNQLIPSDYSGQLTSLLRYPSPDPSYKIFGVPHHTILLLRQALALQLSPNPATGSTIVMENRTLLKIPIEVPSSGSTRSPRRPRPVATPGAGTPDGTSRGHVRQSSGASAGNLSEMFTRGLMERGESLGINKTLMNAVTEIRRNIPEFATTLGRPSMHQATASFQLADERLEEKPVWEGPSRFAVDKELAQLRSRDKSLGESLAWIVDSLLQDESDEMDVAQIKSRKRDALESLAYVRDVLMLNSVELEQDRLARPAERSQPAEHRLARSDERRHAERRPVRSDERREPRIVRPSEPALARPAPVVRSAGRLASRDQTPLVQDPLGALG